MILFLDGYLSKQDEDEGQLFSGFTGKLFRACLSQMGVDLKEHKSHVIFPLNPPGNSIKGLCVKKPKKKSEPFEAAPGLSAVTKGFYLHKQYAPHLERLREVIDALRPTLIVTLGQEALWAVSGSSNLKSVRGTTFYYGSGNSRIKVLPTYSPESVVQQWNLKPVFLAHLDKVKRESAFPDVRRPFREIWIYPSLADLYRFEQEHILPSNDLSIDIETSGIQITCIGFSPRPDIAIVVPFTDRENKSSNYWLTRDEEIQALVWCKRMCGLKKDNVVGQNFLYDMNHLWTNYGITVTHANHDTMLLHHAMQPELEKGLGFLGSVYTDEASWKFMRTKHETIKRED